jgi:hypothetical protein
MATTVTTKRPRVLRTLRKQHSSMATVNRAYAWQQVGEHVLHHPPATTSQYNTLTNYDSIGDSPEHSQLR